MGHLNDKVTIYKTIVGKPDPHYITVATALNWIKGGRWADAVNKVMDFVEANPLDATAKQLMKRETLPVLCFTGEFTDRAKSGLLVHNGLMILDYDGFTTIEQLDGYRKTLQSWPETMAVFKSPSGLGLKTLVKIPVLALDDKELYTQYFEAFNKKWASEYWDPSSMDISRACYVSSDPELYLNEYSVVFKPDLEKVVEEKSVTYQKKMDDATIYERVKAFNRETSYVQGEKNDFVVSLAGHCCEYGVSEEYATDKIIADFVTIPAEVNENEIRIKSVYRARIANSATFSTITPLPTEESTTKFKGEGFYHLYLNPKSDEAEYMIAIDTVKLFEWLQINGFYKLYRADDSEPIFVHSVNNVVSLSSAHKIKDFILQYAKTIDFSDYTIVGPGLEDKIINNGAYNNPKYFGALENIVIDPLTGGLDWDYLYFRNGILKVTRAGCELIPYTQLDKMVWKSSIQDRDFTQDANYKSDYAEFIRKLSKGSILELESAIGFLLSSYKDVADAKAIILNDEEIDDDPQGGSGKDLLLKGVSYLREVIKLDGKNWRSNDNFAFQRVTESTHLIVLEDAARYFKFESVFPLITSEVIVNPKNRPAFDIPFELAPKFAITTNYVIQGTSQSHLRRKVDYELKKIYGANYTPLDDFGKRFFDQWDDREWNQFDNFMVHCLMVYLNKGIVPQEDNNIPMKALIESTSYLFPEWADHHIGRTQKFFSNKLKEVFVKDNSFGDDFSLSGERFAKWTSEYANFRGWKKVVARGKSGDRGFRFEEKAPHNPG